MRKGTIDRRVERTRGQLQRALLALLSEKSYEKISVGDICDVANVGRSTFYAHYTGKDDLKRGGLDDHLRALLKRAQSEALAKPNGASGLGFSLAMFEHARQQIHLYRALLGGRGGAVALATIRRILADLVRRELADGKSDDGIPRELLVQYVVGAFMAVLTWWLDGGAKIPPERIDGLFQRLMTKGIIASG